VLDLNYELEVMPARGGTPRKLTLVNDIPSPTAWSADSTRIIFTELGKLFAIKREGGDPQQLTFAHAAFSPAVAPHGDRLAYADWTRNVNLWRIDLRPRVRGASALLRATS